jgi:cobalt-zinc-cadmium efflux system protein
MAHVHDHSKISGKKLFWTIIFNLLITIAEFIGGILSGYLALLADAVHNLSDVAALILAWLGVKGAELPPTKKSTYGYLRIEVMTAFISAVSLVVISIFIMIEAYDRFLNPQPLTHPTMFLTVATIGLIGNIVSIVLLHSEKGKSLNMKSAFLHMAYDAISSVGVIVGGIVILLTDIYIIDVFLSVLIALMILWSSYSVIKEAILILLEAVPQGIDFDIVHKEILAHESVIDVHDLHIWSLSSKEIALSCHICVDETKLSDGPALTQQLNKMLNEKFKIGHGTIQVETKECNNPELICTHAHGKNYTK